MTDTDWLAFSKTNFSSLDWVIVTVYLSLSLLIGVMVRRFAKNMGVYIGAGRSVGTWLGVATMTGTEMGLITVMYSAEKGFKGGFAAFHIAVIAGVVTFLVGLTGLIVVPLRRRRVLTIPEFYEQRFGRKTRVLGGIMLAFGGILNMGLFLKVGSMFIVAVAGMPPDGNALPLVMTGLLALVLVYTVLGGMVSVIITDYLQFVVLAIGLVATSLLAISHLGFHEIFDVVWMQKGTAGFDPLAAEGEFGTEYVVWMAVGAVVSCAVWPTAVARALAMESPTAVRYQYTLSSISFTIRFMIPYFWGICALVFIVTRAPDLQPIFIGTDDVPPTQSALQAMPVMLGRLLPTGVLGLMTAAMIAAFMSTHDSYLLCWSSVITQDIIGPLSGDKLSEENRIRITRVLIVVIGIYIWIWGVFYQGKDDIWDYMMITGSIYFTGAIAVLIGGLYWRGASSTGAFCALLAGFSALLGLGPIRQRAAAWIVRLWELPPQSSDTLLTSARVGLLSVGFTVVVFVVLSLLFPDPPLKTDQEVM